MNDLQNVSVPTAYTPPRLKPLKRVMKALANSLERARTRRLLGQLDERHLSDLGISHADRLAELHKPFWR